MDFCEHGEIAVDKRKKVKFVLNGNPTIVSSSLIANNLRLSELIIISCKSLNIKPSPNDTQKIRIFRTEGVELFEDDLKYLKQNEILYISPNGEDFDDCNNFAMYKMKKKVGKGGYGSVYEAKHRITKERIAIKKINGSNIRSAKDIEMMFKEISLLKNLSHKNIIKVQNCYTLKHEMKVAIILEYLEGGDLREFLEKQPDQYIDEEAARKIFLQLFNAIQYCHREKIIHRDLKLENIMFTNKNFDTIKVVDFGISGTQNLINIDYTQAGSVRYFSPEVLSTKAPAHPSIDIWAMGCILFWMITGNSPFPQSSREEVFNHILKGNYSVPTEAKARMTQSVQDLIEKMLQVDINKRISMTEMAQHEWLRCTVEEIREKERKEQEQADQQQIIKTSRISTKVQKTNKNNGSKTTQKIQIGCNSWICNVIPGSKIEFIRKIEGGKQLSNPTNNHLFNNPLLRKNSLNYVEQEINLNEEKQPSSQKKNSSQSKLPQISEQNSKNNSNKKKPQNQRILRVNKEQPLNFSSIDSASQINQAINSQNLGTSFAGLLTPKQFNTPGTHRNSFSYMQNALQSNNKTPLYQQKEGNNNIINENSYIVNKSYVNQNTLQNKLVTNNSINNQHDYQLKVNNNFNNITSSQKKVITDKISPLQSPINGKNQLISSFKDIPPMLLRKNEQRFNQQKLIQITTNTPQIPSITELDGNQNKFGFMNLQNNAYKHRNSHLVVPSHYQDQDSPQENQLHGKFMIQKRTHTLF